MDLPARPRARSRSALLVSALVLALTVGGGVLTSAQAADGTVSGTVTEAGTGTQLANVHVQAYCWVVTGSAQGQACGESQTAANGSYSLPLAPGTYKVSFDDFPTHATRFYGGGTSLVSVDSLVVTVSSAGSSTGINAALVRQYAVSGTVTGNGSAQGGINVTAYRLASGSWQQVDDAVTASDGGYSLHLPNGSYRIGFTDAHGPFRSEYFNDATTLEGADTVVVAGTDIAGKDADLALNHPITGTVTVDGINMPAVVITAWQEDLSAPDGWTAVKTAETGQDGNYAIYLPDGIYRIEFRTWQNRFPTNYYPGVASLDAAQDVTVAGAEVPNIGATIFSETPDSGPAITGTVTVSGIGGPPDGLGVAAWRWNARTSTWVDVRDTVTLPDGTYVLHVPEGTYRVEFNSFARYRRVYYDGAQSLDTATDVVVPTAGAQNIDAVVVENGSIRGTVTADPVPDLPPGPPPTLVSTWQWDENAQDWLEQPGTFAGPDGSYRIFVPEGTYRISFNDYSGYYQRPLFYGGTDNVGAATDVVQADADVIGIDAHLVVRHAAPPATWKSSSKISDSGQDGWSPQVAVGPGGVATAVWSGHEGAESRIRFSTRPANGPWSSPSTLSAAGVAASDPQVAIGPDGTEAAAWREWDGAHYRIVTGVKGPGGSWTSPTSISAAGRDAWAPQVSVGAKGAVTVVWRRSDGTHERVQVSTRAPKKSWSSPTTLSGSAGDAWDPQVADGAAGVPIATWSYSFGSTSRVQVAMQSAQGSWTVPTVVSGSGQNAQHPQVAVGATGVAAVIWSRDDGSSERIDATTRSPGGAWSAPATLSTAGRDGHDPQVAVDQDGLVTAAWLRWDGTYDRVQTAMKSAGGAWSDPTTISEAGHAARFVQVAASPSSRATLFWSQSFADNYDAVDASVRMSTGAWTAPQVFELSRPGAASPQVAAGPDGTVAGVWEARSGADDRVDGVVRVDPQGLSDDLHCRNLYNVDLNIVFGVAEQFVHSNCLTVTAKSAWRPLMFWYDNSIYDQVPPGYVPTAGTPQGDLLSKITAVTVVVDGGTKKQKVTTFAPSKVLRSDLILGEYFGLAYPFPMTATLPKMPALPVGSHTVAVFWTLSAEHCDGFTDDQTISCLPAGKTSYGTETFKVVNP